LHDRFVVPVRTVLILLRDVADHACFVQFPGRARSGKQ